MRPGSTGTLLRNPDVPGYNFEVIHPLDVVYDLSQPARFDTAGTLIDPEAHRVVSASLLGHAIAPDARFILCTNSYRAGGAGQFAGARATNLVLSDERVTRDILRHHVARTGTLGHGSTGGSLHFAPLPRTSVIYETGPAAYRHLEQIAGFRPISRGLTRQGFLRLKLDLSQGA